MGEEEAVAKRAFAKLLNASGDVDVARMSVDAVHAEQENMNESTGDEDARKLEVQVQEAQDGLTNATALMEKEKVNLLEFIFLLVKGRDMRVLEQNVESLEKAAGVKREVAAKEVLSSPMRKRRNIQMVFNPSAKMMNVGQSPKTVGSLPYVSLENITNSSRGFKTVGRLTYLSLGEKSAKGIMKVNATISYGNVGREMFTLGNEHMSQWAQVSYDDIVEVCGFKPMMRENGLTLVAYGGQEVTIRRTDNSDIPTPEEDLLKLSVLEVARKPDACLVEMVIYVMKIHEVDTRPLFGRDFQCQDIYVQDQNQHGMIVELMEEAVGRAAAGEFYLAKGVKCYKGSIQVWGTSMFVKAPDDLQFDVAAKVVREW